MKPDKPEKRPINLNLSGDTRKKAEDLSAAHTRSLSNLVTVLIDREHARFFGRRVEAVAPEMVEAEA